jgi:integrase
MAPETDPRPQTALVPSGAEYRPALRNAVRLWADATTAAESARRGDLARDKRHAVLDFFSFAGKHPADVSPVDVKDWQTDLAARNLRANTVYVRTSFLSSFYAWAMRHPELGAYIRTNPARLARPRAPKPYQTESVKSLTDEELQSLVEVVRRRAEAGDLVGKRDYALLLLYVATGMRRQEIISLRGRDVRIDEAMTLSGRVKGGNYLGREVSDPEVKEALLDYLTAAKRLHALKTDAPLWTRHDGGGRPGEPLTSHAFAKNLKRYARLAGLERINLHQTRHTFARIVAEETGSIAATQDALDHRNPATTRAYVRRIGLKRDLHSARVTSRLRK